ncbi:MAG: tRNA pseudouridine(38-40) synthase TruA [Bdellovibrionales bacterium]
MTRWKLTLEYDGTDFRGWQRQAHDVSVQQVVEEAIEKFSGETVTIHVAGRTDAGVHARAQVAHVDLAKETEAGVIRDALNFHVRPHRVSVLNVEEVPESFHARFEVKARSYRYQILNRRGPPALFADHVWHLPKPLAIEPMQEAAKILIGKHDFSTFRAQHCQSNSPIRTLDALDVYADGELILFHTRARSFLYHQVRNMVGTLVMVGNGQWSIDDFKSAFAAKDRKAGGPTAPPQGLFFWEVEY